MNYEQLIKKFAKQAGLAYDDAAQFIDGFFAVIKLGMATKDPVKISRFGSFTPKVIKSKLSRNKATKKVEIKPDGIYPKFKISRSKQASSTKRKVAQKRPPVKKIELPTIPVEETPVMYRQEISENPATVQEQNVITLYYKKMLYLTITFLVVFSAVIFSAFLYYRNNILKNDIEKYLSETGITHTAIEELVDSKSQDIMDKTEEYNKEITATLSTQLKRIKEQQEVSLAKLSKMEKHLQAKITKMIKPQLKKRNKRAQVKMTLYTVKKNDTLWMISKKYLKNPYNWVGLYKTNGQKIKDPDKIYPGQKLFIPIIKEY